MPTVKQIKADLDALGIEYPPGALKADLEALLAEAMTPSVEPERPRNIKSEKPDYIEPEDDFVDAALSPVVDKTVEILRSRGFIDPNADPATQAD